MCRLIVSPLLAFACATAIAAAAPVAGALTRDAQVKQNVRLLKSYIDGYAAGRSFVFPAAAVVRKGGGLTAPVWPANPWTGRPMAPGSGPGAFTYTPGAGGTSYTLAGHLSSGAFTVTGGTPSWLTEERSAATASLGDAQAATAAALAAATAAQADATAARAARDTAILQRDAAVQQREAAEALLATTQGQLTSAQADLASSQNALAAKTAELATTTADLATSQAALSAAQASLTTARNSTAELGARVIKGYVEQWGMLYNATSPAAADVSKTGSVGAMFSYWPDNPFTGQPMAAGAAIGDFTYTQGADGTSYLLSVHKSATSVSLDGAVPQQLRTAMENLRSALTNANIWKIQNAVDRYAVDYNDTPPAHADQATLGAYLDPWPLNPWFASTPMTDATSRGNYSYTTTGFGTYSITAYVAGGAAGDVVDGTWWTSAMGIRDRLKNMYCQAAAQTLREYVEEWKAGHAGPPTADEMTKTGAVGLAHAWWPTCPWTSVAMANADIKGNFQYSRGVDGAYTLTIRQQPISPFTQYYTPQ